ncbi:MAG: sigma-54-dependent Fis family transcriptional regulator, partial [Nitrospirae bacterium]|nr:sigma-54-dependent Fis family transcriptional regulator [Nitrospirota bacterium]
MEKKEASILIVDDDESFRLLLESHLKSFGFKPVMADSGANALEILKKGDVDLIIADQVMPEMDGIEFLARVKSKYGDIPFIMITAYGEIKKAVASVKNGAYDYLEKPYNHDDLLATIKRALDYSQVKISNGKLREQLTQKFGLDSFIHCSEAMKEVVARARQVAKHPDTTVAIYGETGVGKEVLARDIHYSSSRGKNLFVVVNCAAIPETLIESELFGYVKGAFTGADRDRKGRFTVADGGALFLDEIGELPLSAQVKLLRVIETKGFEKVGSSKTEHVDCRIITATNKDLAAAVREGKFREDLFHRINIMPIKIPPLRERTDDIPLLAEYFLKRFSEHFGGKVAGFSKAAMDMMLQYRWPGNVREL